MKEGCEKITDFKTRQDILEYIKGFTHVSTGREVIGVKHSIIDNIMIKSAKLECKKPYITWNVDDFGNMRFKITPKSFKMATEFKDYARLTPKKGTTFIMYNGEVAFEKASYYV